MPHITYPTFSTTKELRSDTGFTDNEFIEDEEFDIQRERAYGEILTALTVYYAIPDLEDANFIDSPASKWLKSVEIMIGGGYMLIREYGEDGRGTDKDGFRRIADGRSMLKDLSTKKVALIWKDWKKLAESIGTDFADQGGVIGSINPDPTFRVNMEF